MSKKVCFIVGVHRSGTSAFTGLLEIFGASSNTFLDGKYRDLEGYSSEGNIWNEKGYFENPRLGKINEEAIQRIGTWWSDCRPAVSLKITDAEIQRISQEIYEAISDEIDLSPSDLLVIKDPRIVSLLPAYNIAMSRFNNVSFSFINTLRDREANIGSLVRRGSLSSFDARPTGTGIMDNEWASLIIDRHNKLLGLHLDRDCNYFDHHFDRLFEGNLGEYFQHISSTLGLGLTINDETISQANEFIENRLRHH